VQVLLPSPTYKAFVWSDAAISFIEAKSDIMEQQHWNKDGTKFIDYKIYVQTIIPADSIAIVKLVKTNETRMPSPCLSEALGGPLDPKLKVAGYTEGGQLLFNYQNPAQGVDQSFGINIKKYRAHQEKVRRPERATLSKSELNLTE